MRIPEFDITKDDLSSQVDEGPAFVTFGEVIERHFASLKRCFGLKYFHIQGYSAVTQFVFSVCSAALIVAFIAACCQRPDLAVSRLKVVAFVNA